MVTLFTFHANEKNVIEQVNISADQYIDMKIELENLKTKAILESAEINSQKINTTKSEKSILKMASWFILIIGLMGLSPLIIQILFSICMTIILFIIYLFITITDSVYKAYNKYPLLFH